MPLDLRVHYFFIDAQLEITEHMFPVPFLNENEQDARHRVHFHSRAIKNT